jgi:hypothetical protein
MGNLINLPNITPESIVVSNDSSNGNYAKPNAFNEKNYLNVRLDEKNGEEQKTLTIRLLPMDLETGNPFVKVHMHNVHVPKEVSKSGYKSYICLAKNKDINHEKYGNKCPFCELNQNAYQESLKETDPIKKKNFQDISIANKSNEAVIVRCIERGKEDEGVKFWKFNLRRDKTDPYNTIINLYNMRKEEGERAGQVLNILDIYNGRDLNVTITKGNAAPQILDASLSTPLSRDEEQMKKWIYDEKKWQDVFSTKPYEYLSLISQMKIPWYDREQGKWVDKEEIDAKKQGQVEQVDEANAEIERAMASAGVAPEPVQEPVAPVQDFTDSLIMKDDADLPF